MPVYRISFYALYSILIVLLETFAGARDTTVIYDHTGTTIGPFTGGDIGEGLDLDGIFLSSVNLESNVADQRARDVNFV